MVTEQDLLDSFDLDELDDTRHECVLTFYESARGYVRAVAEDLVAEGKTADTAGRIGCIRSALTIQEMQDVARRWSCINYIVPVE